MKIKNSTEGFVLKLRNLMTMKSSKSWLLTLLTHTMELWI